MSNHLKVAMIDIISSLHRKGWSQRRIARELEIDRETVARYLKQIPPAPKPANSPPGSISPDVEPKPANRPPARMSSISRRMQLSHCWVRLMTTAAEPAVA